VTQLKRARSVVLLRGAGGGRWPAWHGVGRRAAACLISAGNKKGEEGVQARWAG
jgi:hypothetical protein